MDATPKSPAGTPMMPDNCPNCGQPWQKYDWNSRKARYYVVQHQGDSLAPCHVWFDRLDRDAK